MHTGVCNHIWADQVTNQGFPWVEFLMFLAAPDLYLVYCRNSYWATVQCRYALIVQHVLVFHPWSCPRIPGNIFKAVGDFCSAWFLTPALGFQKLIHTSLWVKMRDPFRRFQDLKPSLLEIKLALNMINQKNRSTKKKLAISLNCNKNGWIVSHLNGDIVIWIYTHQPHCFQDI